jgi:uncharacterized membrane protein YphA (DoxX/SURF4 family)
MFRNILVASGSFLLGAVFILSAWFKLFPIEPFEYQITGTTFFGWTLSVFVARIVIAIEFALGFLLLISYRLKPVLIFTIILLSVFCIHLLYTLIAFGNSNDCGCMGSLMTFTPLQGILKNVVMIALAILLYYKAFNFEFARMKHFIYYVFILASAAVFAGNPVDLGYASKYLNKPYQAFDLPLDTLYNYPYDDKVEKPVSELRHKKSVLLFFSASCPHCKIAASKVSVMLRKNPSIPFYMFINGDRDKIQSFLIKTATEKVPHSQLNGPLFVSLAGLNLPVLYYYNKGRVELQVDYYTLEQYHVESWLKKP